MNMNTTEFKLHYLCPNVLVNVLRECIKPTTPSTFAHTLPSHSQTIICDLYL